MTAVTHPRTPSFELSMFRGARLYLWLSALAILLATASLRWPSTPSYDPWSWLIWGRQILHGHLWIAGGTSWKPLPVIFTTVFALFGSAQPDLWLIVARAGAAMSAIVSAKLAARIVWHLVSRGREPGWFTGLRLAGRVGAVLPVLLAGLIALIGTGFTPTYPVPMLLGYSEGLAFTIVLVAAERAWDGHPRQAFVLGLLPCLDRPELWIIWGPYGLWLMWHDRRRDRRTFALVIGLGLAMLLFWAVPQGLGGGKITDLVGHAHSNHSVHSAVNTAFPFWHELNKVLWPLVLERVEAAALLLIVLTALIVWRDRRRGGGWSAALRRHGALAAAALAGAGGFLWWLLISAETQAGFAGNTRYAILGVLLIYVGGAAAYGWACVGLARAGGRLLSRVARRPVGGRELRLALGSLVMTAVFLFVPFWFAHRLPSVRGIRLSLRYQAQLRERVASLVARAGGAQKVMGCGSVMTNNYEVTLVAWYLGVPIPFIQAVPQHPDPTRVGPNVVFQAGAVSTKRNVAPSPGAMQAWNLQWQRQTHTHYRVTERAPVTMYMDCARYSPT